MASSGVQAVHRFVAPASTRTSTPAGTRRSTPLISAASAPASSSALRWLPSSVGRGRPRTQRTRAAEMMGVPLYPDDLLEACAPWGNVCVVAGTHYIPIALPSILGTVFLLAPLVAVAAKLQQSAAEVTRKDLRIEELEEEVDRLTRGLERGKE